MSDTPHGDYRDSESDLNLPRQCQTAIERGFKFLKTRMGVRGSFVRVRECRECGRLWEKYTDATFAFVKINRTTKMAQLRQESLELIALLREGDPVAFRYRLRAR